MRLQILVAVAALFALGFFVLDSGVTGRFADSETKLLSLHDHGLRFFQVADVVFPPNSVCAGTAMDIYSDIAMTPLDKIDGYVTSGVERFSTQNFVIDRINRYGTADFVKSPTFVENADSMISINSEAVVSVPRGIRHTFLVMDLYGVTVNRPYGPVFAVTRGRYSTPSIDCVFVVQGKNTVCDCDVHSIQGIAVGGVTSPPLVQDTYRQLIEKYQLQLNITPGYFNGDFVVE